MLLIPRGNLIQNPGFELGLEFWVRPSNTPFAGRHNVVATGRYSHSGLSSALLGHYNPEYVACIYQEVPVSPGYFYELDFHLAGADRCPANVSAEVRWLDDCDMDIGIGLAILTLASSSACDGQWTLHTGVTDEAPPGARKARVSFTSSKAPVLLDDVLFFRTE